ncbi:hypothetical protein KAT95_00330 [Candidatus Parcubacteria bacterium]|nr:hypothetical protein [Candidatus Parcubacteria bacterium]
MEDQIFVIFNTIWNFLRTWWWIILPFILIKPFLFIYLWWRNQVWFGKMRSIVLEIKPPKEVLRPIKAMETVFNGLWHFYDPPNYREKWFEGKMQLGFSLEIACFGGEPHFFIRIPENARNLVESTLYSQYPDLEIKEVDDYTKKVPQDVPNKDWEIWGTDYEQLKDDIYPIKTYSKFFEEKPEISKEEKRIDPMSNLLEGMAKFKPGEQLWVQIMAKPVSHLEESKDFIEKAKKEVDKLVNRPKPSVSKPIVEEAIDVLVTGEPPKEEEEKKEGGIMPAMELTPGEMKVVSAIEDKISKYAFECSIRFLQLGKRDVFFSPNKAIPMGFFDLFGTVDLNGLKPMRRTITKVHTVWLWFLDNRRVYVRKRRMFRNFIERLGPFCPWPGGTFILNIEELASLYHFPGRGVTAAPSISRVEAKRGEAPIELPTE